MAEYIVFRADVFGPSNEVHFVYSLDDALDRHGELERDTGKEWGIAEVLPTDSWIVRLYLWLHKRGK